MEPEVPAVAPIILPPLMSSPADVSRVRRELAALDQYLSTLQLRQPGVPIEHLPKLSRILDDLVQTNNVNLLHETARSELEAYLDDVIAHAPIIHVGFAADPSSASLQKIVTWLRQNIQPNVLVRVGLQPNIVAGCVLRTTNRYFDFSLRQYLEQHRNYLVEAFSRSPQPAVPEAAATEEPAP